MARISSVNSSLRRKSGKRKAFRTDWTKGTCIRKPCREDGRAQSHKGTALLGSSLRLQLLGRAAGALDFFAGGRGEGVSVYGQFFLQVALAENFDACLRRLDETGVFQEFGRHDGAVVKCIKRLQVHRR